MANAWLFHPCQKRNRQADVEAMRAAAKDLDAMIATWGDSEDELMVECKEIRQGVCDIEVDGFLFLFLSHWSERTYTHREESMPDTLASLESDRAQLLEEFLRLGDLRPGSITAVVRRCGKPSCHCAQQNDPGHDPQFRLTCRVAGKTVTESFANPQALRKAQLEVAEFHRFRQLSKELVDLNAKICALRPVEQQRGGWTEPEKKRLLRSLRRWRGE
jgi:hypothetical protein